MWRRLTVGVLVVGLAVAIIENRIGPAEGAGILGVVILGYFSLRSFCTMKGRTEFKTDDEDDSGIDWREDGGASEAPQMWNGWAILFGDCAVFEAREAADRLEAAGIRCRLEVLHEDKAFHRFGNGGMGTRMCVLVPPGEYERAKAVASHHSCVKCQNV